MHICQHMCVHTFAFTHALHIHISLKTSHIAQSRRGWRVTALSTNKQLIFDKKQIKVIMTNFKRLLGMSTNLFIYKILNNSLGDLVLNKTLDKTVIEQALCKMRGDDGSWVVKARLRINSIELEREFKSHTQQLYGDNWNNSNEKTKEVPRPPSNQDKSTFCRRATV